jgi:hypothetical protein
VRQLELERGVKARPNGLLFPKPKGASYCRPSPRQPQDLARYPGIAHQVEFLTRREVIEVNLGTRFIGSHRSEEERNQSGAAAAGFHIGELN